MGSAHLTALGTPDQHLTIQTLVIAVPYTKEVSTLTQQPNDKGDFRHAKGMGKHQAAPSVHCTPVLSPTTLLSLPTSADCQTNGSIPEGKNVQLPLAESHAYSMSVFGL